LLRIAFHIAKLRAEHTLRVSDVGSHCAESNRMPKNSAYDRIKKGWMSWSYCRRGVMTNVHRILLLNTRMRKTARNTEAWMEYDIKIGLTEVGINGGTP
jgi:hypothetical protein